MPYSVFPALSGGRHKSDGQLRIIFGLGNPGLRYRFSRHNLGFLVIERLARVSKIRVAQFAFDCLAGEGVIKGRRVVLVKPLTFVNLSGRAVAAILKQKRIDLSDLLVVCDDTNLPLGRMRIRSKGSDGGHKGLRSIIGALGSCGFARLRIGVGPPGAGGRGADLSRYVLGRFSKRQMKIVNMALEDAADCCEHWLEKGIDSAMNSYN